MATPPPQSALIEDDTDHPMQSENESSHSESGSDNDNDSDEDEQVEWLVNNREKRATAGNRLSTLVQQAAADDDELNLLFEEPEDEEDEGFEEGGDDAGSDVQMDSSDDDDDQGPTAGAEELDGEKELQRAERQSRKRKANDGIPKAFRKKVKIHPTAPLAPAPQQKKKLDRASWIPKAAEGPIRASSRSTTKESKEHLRAQMIEREKKRLRQLKSMEKAAATRNANKAKELTQEDRLKEAARVEKHNAKSLNKWEEAEKLREEERRQKLEDLHNRRLDGPVITWWSGMAEWVNGKIKRVGKIQVEEKPKTTAIYMTKKRRAEMEAAAEASKRESIEPGSTAPLNSFVSDSSLGAADVVVPTLVGTNLLQPYASTAAHSIPHLATRTEVELENSSISENQDAMNDAVSNIRQPTPAIQQTPPPLPEPSNSSPDPQSAAPLSLQRASETPETTLPTNTLDHAPLPRMAPSPDVPFTFTSIQPQTPRDLPPVIDHSTRNCIILENFDEAAVRDKAAQAQILFGRNTVKPPVKYKTAKVIALKEPTCVVTGYPAKFRDPSTGLPYYNAYAYKEIQKLKRGEYRWSSLLQVYVGQSAYAARGVPARFLEKKA